MSASESSKQAANSTAIKFPPFPEQVAVRLVEEDVFESVLAPHRMGNIAPIAYGGNTLAVAANAAVQTIQPHQRPYSVMGYYLGPAQTDRPLRCKVHRIRDTKTFATRRVTVDQKLDNGKARLCLELTVDFQTEENPYMHYSATPTREYSGVEDSETYDHGFQRLENEGTLPKGTSERWKVMFGAALAYLETRQCPESVSAQNMGGAAKHTKTTMDHLPITDKSSAEWIRMRQVLSQPEQLAALIYILDGALSFTPLVHDHKYFDDVGACSSLDFALRIFAPTLKLDEWHLRERKTIAANAGRTYTEGRYWNSKGEMVATMSQQSIMRAPPTKPSL